MQGSNLRPPACKAGALPAELILQQLGYTSAHNATVCCVLNIYSLKLVTRTGFEPVLPPWKGGVLTAWPTGQ